MHIFITGSPGAGKTTMAKKLAHQTGLPVIHVDQLEGWEYTPSGSPGTEKLRKCLKNLTKPHIIEGAQVLGLREEEVRGHRVIIIEQLDDTLVDRLLDRGWNTNDGQFRKGERWRHAAEELVAEFKDCVASFRIRTTGISIQDI